MTVDLTAPTRERLLVATLELTEAGGWGSVTMAQVAKAAGVSRQTVYNEFGTKHGLAQQLALFETVKFLDVARIELEGADDVVEGLRAACRAVLIYGESNVLFRSIVGTWTDDADADFLAVLTTESGQIVELATEAIRPILASQFGALPISSEQLDVAVEMVIRLVLSHLTRPGKSPSEAADEIAWLAERVLGVSTGV